MSALDELLARVKGLPEDQQQALAKDALAATRGRVWVPNPGPQTDAFFCEADELFYGGQAGGGKSDLLIGLALTAHTDSVLLRRLNDDVKDLAKRGRSIAGDGAGYNGQDRILSLNDAAVRFGGCQFEEDKERYKGKARDLYGFDEIGDFTFTQYKFITTWNRSAKPGQRCRVVAAGNPPTRPEGLWIVQYWGAWLDPLHPNPAKAGELRWYIRGPSDEDIEVERRGPHVVEWSHRPMMAKSRTFIPSALEDNPDLASTDYGAMLDSLPAELRKAYRDGDFGGSITDDEWQVIPTHWIEAAMQRWTPTPPKNERMTALAVDVAPGGGDERVIAFRYGGWFGKLIAKREADKSGRLTAAEIVKHRRDRCPVIIDLGGGWGGDTLIALKDNVDSSELRAFNGVVVSNARTRDGKLKFRNKRSETTWRLREALDPEQEGGSCVALPPDPALKADLASYRWELTLQGILIEDKVAIKKRLGRSPDKGDAVVMCVAEGDAAQRRLAASGRRGVLPVFANRGYATLKR